MTEPRQGEDAARTELRFRGGWAMSFVPVAVFLFFCVLFFVVLQAFDMAALAMGGFLALLTGALFARHYSRYWDAVMRGIGSPTSVAIIVILLVIGMFAELVKVTDVSDGFVWLAHQLGVGAGWFVFFTFLTVCAVAMATGSSIGSMFTAFPIFFPAGVALGADPALLAGAILSGAVFGDNLAPISDTTIISAATQRFRRTGAVADIGGVVRARAKYALPAAAVSAVAFLLLGSVGADGTASTVLPEDAAPDGLIMLAPVAVMLAVAFVTRNIFKAATVGLVLGTITALATGLLTVDGVIGVSDGAPTGFLTDGLTYMFGTVALVTAVFGIVGVLTEAGVLDRATGWLVRSRAGTSARGTEASIAAGSVGTAALFGGVTSASMLAFGPITDELGARRGLHPYRRANVMDCFTMGVGGIVPFLSAYLFIASSLTAGYDEVAQVGVPVLFLHTVYPLALTVVLVLAVVTGWGRRFEDGVAGGQDTVDPTGAPAGSSAGSAADEAPPTAGAAAQGPPGD